MKTKIGYICMTDFDHHMGETGKRLEHADPKGVTIYPTLSDLRRNEQCTQMECGIVRVKVVLDKVIRKSRM